MNKMELQKYIKEWLSIYHEEPKHRKILEQATKQDNVGKQWTDAIQYFIHGVSIHNPRKAKIREACRELLENLMER